MGGGGGNLCGKPPPETANPSRGQPAGVVAKAPRNLELTDIKAEIQGILSAGGGMVDEGMLETLLTRLENVTARLESLEGKIGGAPGAAPRAGVPAPPAPPPPPTAGGGGGSAGSPAVAAFDAILASQLARLVAAGKSLGGEYANVTGIVEKGFKAERGLVAQIVASRKPSVDQLQGLVGPVGEQIMAAHTLADGKRTDAFNHFKTVAEAMGALSWVAYTGPDCGLSLPAPHVDESWQSAEFWANKVLMQHKATGPNHVEWVKAIKELFLALKAYVKDNHTAGPAWNPQGGAPGSAPPPPPVGGPPPPPPPPPPGSLTAARGAPASGGGPGGMNAVFSELNKGEAVTSGLKKVTDDMKTKNRADRTGVVPVASHPIEKGAAKVGGAGSRAKGTPSGPPKMELQQGRKWLVENQDGNKQIVIENVKPNQTVYIYKCRESVVQIKGKANNITLDNCRKVGVVFENVLAVCEAINSESCEVQCTGNAPSIAIDECAGMQVYLPATGLECVIATAKSSEVNVLTPSGDDMVESPLPEQFLSKYDPASKAWATEPVAHSGA